MSKKKKKNKEKSHPFESFRFRREYESNVLYKTVDSIVDLSEVVTGEIKPVSANLSLAPDAVYATVLESFNSQVSNPVLIVPVPVKQFKKAVKKHKVFTVLDNMYYDMSDLIIKEGEKFVSGDRAEKFNLVILDDVKIPVKEFNVNTNREPLTVIFMSVPEKLSFNPSAEIGDELKETYVPEDYADAGLTTIADVVIATACDVAKRLGHKLVSFAINPKDKLMDYDTSENTAFSGYVNAMRKVFNSPVFAKNVDAVWINTSSEPMYTALCKR